MVSPQNVCPTFHRPRLMSQPCLALVEFEGRGGWVDQIRAAFARLSNQARGIRCIALDLDVRARGGTCTLHVL